MPVGGGILLQLLPLNRLVNLGKRGCSVYTYYSTASSSERRSNSITLCLLMIPLNLQVPLTMLRSYLPAVLPDSKTKSKVTQSVERLLRAAALRGYLVSHPI